MNDKPVGGAMILVVAAVIVDDLSDPTRLLAARRAAGALAGGWEFPGGKVEPREDPTAALHRELAEELQITVDLGTELCPPDGDTWPIVPEHELRLWFAVVTSGKPTPTGSHDELRWLSGDQLGTVDWLPADRAIIAELSDRLRVVGTVRERRYRAPPS
jgi:8-oxo-dGTP diphosphatase